MSKNSYQRFFYRHYNFNVCICCGVRAAARESDIDGDGISDGGISNVIDPATIINTNITLNAGAYVFKNLIVTNNAVLTLKTDTSPDGFNGICITADEIIVQGRSSLYVDGMGHLTGQDLAVGGVSTDTVTGEQEVKFSISSGDIRQSVTDYPEQIKVVPEGCLAAAPEDLDSCEINILMDDDVETHYQTH